MPSLSVNRVEHYVRNWIVFGFFIYFGAFYLLRNAGILITFLAFVVLPVLMLCATTRFKCIHDKRAIFVCAIFLGYLTLTALWGEGSLWTAVGHALCILCFMVSVAIISQRISEEFIIKFILCIGLIVALFYIITILLSNHDLIAVLSSRLSFYDISGFGNVSPINSGIVIGLPVIAAWYFFPRKRWYVKLMLIVTIILCVMLMFVTKSRGPLLAAAITLLSIVLYRRARSDYFLLLLFITLAGMSFLFVNNLSEIIVNRIEENNYRLFIWRETIGRIMDNWMFGQGYGTHSKIVIDADTLIRHAHNSFLEVLRVGGVVGGALLVYMLATMLRFSYIHSENKFYLFWLFFGSLCLSTNAGLLLINPRGVQFFGFWLPLFLFYFQRKIPDSPTADISVTHEESLDTLKKRMISWMRWRVDRTCKRLKRSFEKRMSGQSEKTFEMLDLINKEGNHFLREDGLDMPLKEFVDCKNHYSGSVFLMASGSSAGEFPVSNYADFPFIAMNGSILRFVDEKIHPLFYMCTDSTFPLNRPEVVVLGCKYAQHIAMSLKSFSAIHAYDKTILAGKSLYLLDRVNRYCNKKNISDRRFSWSIRKDPDLISVFSLFKEQANRVGFSKDMSRGYFEAQTVVYIALQLAYTLGFQKVFIVGMDLNKKAGRFYEKSNDVLATRLDVDYHNYILPSFKIFSEKILKKQENFKVFNLSLNSRLPDSIVPKITLDQLDQLLAQH